MRYFNEVAYWKIILKNVIVGLLLSPLFLFSYLCFDPPKIAGLSIEPTFGEKIIAVILVIFIIAMTILSNYLLWKKSTKKHPDISINNDKLTYFLKLFGLIDISLASICWPWVVSFISNIDYIISKLFH